MDGGTGVAACLAAIVFHDFDTIQVLQMMLLLDLTMVGVWQAANAGIKRRRAFSAVRLNDLLGVAG